MSNLDKTIETARKMVGEMVQKQREELGLSRTAVGMRCGLNHSQVKAIEEASAAFTLDSLLKIAYGMNCQIFISLETKETEEHEMKKLLERAKKK